MNNEYTIHPGSLFYSGSMTASNTANMVYSFTTPGGTEAGIKLGRPKDPPVIGAQLYMKFVKSKMGKVQVERAKARLKKLQSLMVYSQEMGQRGMYEALSEEVAVLVREAEMVAYGYEQWIDLADIKKYLSFVKDRVVKWEKFENFPRVVPMAVQRKIRALEKAKIFDELHILFIDYTKQELKTTKEKIRAKDPILFGNFIHQPNRFYFIADWVDEYCDLTLDRFVTKFKQECPDFGVNIVEDISPDRWQKIVDETKARHKRLKDTNLGNWRDLEREEAEVQMTKLNESDVTPTPEPATVPATTDQKKWWKFW